jgi:hypothetical protein
MKPIRLALAAWSAVSLVASAGAQPAVTPDSPSVDLDEVGVYAIGYAYRGQPEQQFPLGWSEFFEDRTGVACEPFGMQAGRPAFLLHSPWRHGTGITFQQFVFRLPAAATRILLRGAAAMRSENVTNSDGVTFRLYANGTKLIDYHQTNDVWRAFLANKVVLDIWGGTFTNIATNLTTLAGYGITNCVALIHDWQRSGYDNALPMHYPANASYGGDAGMSHLVATGTSLGIRCALHENLVDYYPNYDLYTTNDIALDWVAEGAGVHNS